MVETINEKIEKIGRIHDKISASNSQDQMQGSLQSFLDESNRFILNLLLSMEGLKTGRIYVQYKTTDSLCFMFHFLGILSKEAALSAEALLTSGTQIIESFPDGLKEFSDILMEEKYAISKMDDAVTAFFVPSSSIDPLLTQSKIFLTKSRQLTTEADTLLGQLSQSTISQNFMESTVALEKTCERLSDKISEASLLTSEEIIERSMSLLKTGAESYLGSDKNVVLNCVKEIFTKSQELRNAEDSGLRSGLSAMANSYETMAMELVTIVDMDETISWTEKLGTNLLSAINDVRKKERPSFNNIGDICAKILTSVNTASRKNQILDDLRKELLSVSMDLETTILFASAGTMNASGNVTYKGLFWAKNLFYVGHTLESQEAVTLTAQQLVKDVKKLMDGMTSDRDALTEAAQIIAKTVSRLAEEVKVGASALTSENQTGQVR